MPEIFAASSAANQFLDGDDGSVFGAMRAGNDGENRSRLGAAKNDDGNLSGGIHAGGDVDEARGFLAGKRRRLCRL